MWHIILSWIASNILPNIEFKDFMKLYKYCTKDSYLFLVIDTTFPSNNSLILRKKLLQKWLLMRKPKLMIKIDGIPPMSTNTHIKTIALLEGDEDIKKEKGLKILTPDKPLTRLLVLLAQIKAGNNSHKLKKEIRKIVYLLYQHSKIAKKLYNFTY